MIKMSGKTIHESILRGNNKLNVKISVNQTLLL